MTLRAERDGRSLLDRPAVGEEEAREALAGRVLGDVHVRAGEAGAEGRRPRAVLGRGRGQQGARGRPLRHRQAMDHRGWPRGPAATPQKPEARRAIRRSPTRENRTRGSPPATGRADEPGPTGAGRAQRRFGEQTAAGRGSTAQGRPVGPTAARDAWQGRGQGAVRFLPSRPERRQTDPASRARTKVSSKAASSLPTTSRAASHPRRSTRRPIPATPCRKSSRIAEEGTAKEASRVGQAEPERSRPESKQASARSRLANKQAGETAGR